MKIFNHHLFHFHHLAFAPVDPLDDGLYDLIEQERRESGAFYDHLVNDEANFSWLDNDRGGNIEFSDD